MTVSANPNYGIIAAAAAEPEIVDLRGTSLSPQILFGGGSVDPGDDSFGTWLFSPVDSIAGITRGRALKRAYDDSSPAGNYTSAHSWVTPNDFQEGPYWIRFRFVAGSGTQPWSSVGVPLPLEEEGDIGDGDWVQLINGGGTRGVTWRQIGYGLEQGTVVVDISTTNSPSGILDTGYYRCVIEAEP